MRKYYYTNARLNKQTALLAGPFDNSADAEICIDLCKPIFIHEQPIGVLASYGVLEVNEHIGLGAYNVALSRNGITVEVPQ